MFHLEIVTPERQFLAGEAEAVTVICSDGELTVLTGHEPMIASLEIGNIKIKQNGTWRTCVSSEGFMDVQPGQVMLFTQACEWPEEIDIARAERAKERAMEQLRQKQSLYEYKHTKVSLSRAMARLSAVGKKGINM